MSFHFHLSLLCVMLIFNSCQRCESREFDLSVTFKNDNEEVITPTFDRVYTTYGERDFIQNATVENIPIDLSRDSTILIFEYGNEIDTLAFGYNRMLNSGNNSTGYCLELRDERVLESNSFSKTYLRFETLFLIGDSGDEYTVVIYI